MRSIIIALALLALSGGAATANPFNGFDEGKHARGASNGKAQNYSLKRSETRRYTMRGEGRAALGKDTPFRMVNTGTGGGHSLLAAAERYVGTNPTGRRSLWCGHFMNLALQRAGYRPSRGNTALGFASYGRPSGPQVGAIAVMRRKGGGHVGVVREVGPDYVVLVSGNSRGRKVAIAKYPKSRIIAYRMPS